MVKYYKSLMICKIFVKGLKICPKVLRNWLMNVSIIAKIHLKVDQQDNSARKTIYYLFIFYL